MTCKFVNEFMIDMFRQNMKLWIVKAQVCINNKKIHRV